MSQPASSDGALGRGRPTAPPPPLADAVEGRLDAPAPRRADDEHVVRWLRVLGGRARRPNAQRSPGGLH